MGGGGWNYRCFGVMNRTGPRAERTGRDTRPTMGRRGGANRSYEKIHRRGPYSGEIRARVECAAL